MRIAFFSWEFYPHIVGGLGTYAIEITRKFVELGHDVTVFTLNPGNLRTFDLWRGTLIHRPQIVDTSRVFPLLASDDLKNWGEHIKIFSDIFSFGHLSASKFINELMRKNQEHFDLVAIHDWLSCISGLVIKQEIDELSTVFHVHSTEQLRSGGEGSRVIRDLEMKMGEEADKIITVSYSMRDHLTYLGYPKEKIRPVWNGCDPEKYDSSSVDPNRTENLKRRYKISSDEQVVFFIGRLTWIKGIYNLIQAMPQVIEEFPLVKFVVLGKGEAYDPILHLAERLNVKKNLILRSEFVSEEERILHYAMSDICVFPSISEPFGIVSLEAMSMGKPVVVGARGVSGFKEQVIPSGPNQCGIHINGENPTDIAWGIKEILNDPKKGIYWGRNGRRRVLQYFTWKQAAENTLNVYNETLD